MSTFFTYTDNSLSPPKPLLKVFGDPLSMSCPITLSWADTIFKAATGIDPVKTSYIGCAITPADTPYASLSHATPDLALAA